MMQNYFVFQVVVMESGGAVGISFVEKYLVMH